MAKIKLQGENSSTPYSQINEGHGVPHRPPVRAGVRVSGFTGTARMHLIVWVSPNLKLFKLSKQILSSIVDKQA